MNVTVVLLAAGHARRFGSDKRLLPVTGDQSLFEYTLSRYQQVFDQCAVVVRDNDPVHRIAERNSSVIVIPQKNLQAGMGDNIALAMAATEIHDSDAVVIALADMPLIRTVTLQSLRDLARRDRIVCPLFESQRGHPVFFGARFFSALSRLAGDTGARGVLGAHAQDVMEIDVDDAGVVADIDTPADWDRIRVNLNSL